VKRLLVLRPEPGAAATLARAAAMGIEAVAAPLFTIAPIAWDAPDPAAFDALMLTSANALRHGGRGLALYHGLPVYAVGEATAAAARAAGFPCVRAGTSDATELLGLLAADRIGQVLHLAGREYREAANPAITITRRIVYGADPVAALPAAATAALRQGAVALLHSPRAARLFAALVDAAALPRDRTALAAISHAAATTAGTGWRAAEIASSPDDMTLLAAAARLCE